MAPAKSDMDRPNPVDFKLYLITSLQALPPGAELLSTVEQALQGGVDAVQLRDKELPDEERLHLARRLRSLTRRYRARLLINGSIDIAMAVAADGVHLGTGSLPVAEARRLLGPSRLIGYSTHRLEELAPAAAQGADFVTFSPIFFTPSKAAFGPPQGLERLQAACSASPLPVFALGGIDLSQVAAVRRSGACGIAVISAILATAEPRAAAASLATALSR